MGSFSIWHWLVVLMVVLLLFGSGKVSTLMGDFAKGIKSFKKTMADDDDASMASANVEHPTTIAAPQAAATTTTIRTTETVGAPHG
ncbi:MAG TPA: twin-arginine translocase TatA/TatE family subunit [Acetobacteraceae bacterium]|nr:twin-arginine translocase TatA/TatE family subunit [Acetobacteraceae bacterium]